MGAAARRNRSSTDNHFTGSNMFAFAWSPDGKQLAFSRGQRKTDVVLMSNFR
ncbi:MAG: hypothetical protein DMG68_22075 [Acidobacteria bacterium]|nr:MAG: hypothetical protein DMG68_22075 [Acidobacteriota bacterium]